MRGVLFSAIALTTLGFAYDGASAKPVLTTPYGCTQKQLNTPGGTQCEKKTEDDVLHHHLTEHYLRCDRGEMECCESVVATGEELDCSEASSRGYGPGPGTTYVPPAGLSPGGSYSPPRRPGRPPAASEERR